MFFSKEYIVMGFLIGVFLMYIKIKKIRNDVHVLKKEIYDFRNNISNDFQYLQNKINEIENKIPPKMKKLLIVGCGRSGTTYTSEILAKMGVNIGHEIESEDGIISWYMTVDGVPPFNLPKRSSYIFNIIIHQVRNPLKVIASAQTFHVESWKYIYAHIPEINKNDSLLIKSAKYWYYWNLLAEKRSMYTYRIEYFDKIANKIIKDIGVGSHDQVILKKYSTNINSREHRGIELSDIKKQNVKLYDNIIELALKYGYTKSDLNIKNKN